MKPGISIITSGLLVALIADLAALGVRAYTLQTALQKSIAQIQTELVKAEEQAAAGKHQLVALRSEMAEQKEALDASPGARETQRRASLMEVIASLKQAPGTNRAAARQPPPPQGPRGIYFPELLGDPEYNRLYSLEMRRQVEYSQGEKLRTLGLSNEVYGKVVSALAEFGMAMSDYQALTGQAGIDGRFYGPEKQTLDKKLLELMGDETFNRWQKFEEVTEVEVPRAGDGRIHRFYSVSSREARVVDANRTLVQRLALRLSYSDSPLQKEQAGQVAEILADCSAGPGNTVYKMMYSDDFIRQASPVLTPTQVQALRDLQAEQEAGIKRSKLPKSSELPRSAPSGK